MGIVIRQSLKASIVSYFGAAIGAFSVLYFLPKCLSPEQIGLTRVLLEASLFFSFFAQLGMSNMVIKFFPYFKNSTKNHNGFIFLVTLLPLIGFILFYLVFIIFRNTLTHPFIEKSKLLTDYYLFIIPLTFFCMYTSICEAYASMLYRIVVPKIIKEVFIRFFTIFITILLFYKILNIREYVLLFVIGYGFATVTNIFYINKIQPISLKPDFSF